MVNIDHVFSRLEGSFRFALDHPTEEAISSLVDSIRQDLAKTPDIDRSLSANWWRHELQHLISWFHSEPSRDEFELIENRCKQYAMLVERKVFTPIQMSRTPFINDKSVWFAQELNDRMGVFIGQPIPEKLTVLLHQMREYCKTRGVDLS